MRKAGWRREEREKNWSLSFPEGRLLLLLLLLSLLLLSAAPNVIASAGDDEASPSLLRTGRDTHSSTTFVIHKRREKIVCSWYEKKLDQKSRLSYTSFFFSNSFGSHLAALRISSRQERGEGKKSWRKRNRIPQILSPPFLFLPL